MKYSFRMIIALLISFTSFTLLPTTIDAVENEKEIKDYIKNEYVDEIEPELLEKDLTTIFESLDPYSTYFTKEELERFNDSINQKFVGIGVSVEVHDEGILITQVFPGSPAEEAGIQAGDIILSADGISLKGKDSQSAITYITGAAGTSVSLEVKQQEQTKTISLTREKIQLPAVTGEKLGGDIGYIRLNTFSPQTFLQLRSVSKEMDDVNHWILDVRNNPGGYLSAAQQVLGVFPDVKTAMHAEFRDMDFTYKAQNLFYKLEEPASLLINENSASASEIVAGSLQDYNAATLYGTTTYGKGLMQQVKQFADGSGVKLSTARFFTPDYNVINSKGISPDVETSTPLEDAHTDALEQFKYQTFDEDTVDTDKTFVIHTNFPVTPSEFKESIHFFKLGGSDLPFTITAEDEDTFMLDPKEDLEVDSEYTLMIHPGWTSTSGETSEKGVIQPITVENE